MARRAVEPILWLLFSAGGVLSALFLPVLVFLFGVAVPLGWLTAPEPERLQELLGNPLTALVVLAVFALSLFHWAQRFRYTLFDGLRLKNHQKLINGCCYTVAVVGSVVSAVVLWQVRQ
jgi:fumarate reductase subunit D